MPFRLGLRIVAMVAISISTFTIGGGSICWGQATVRTSKDDVKAAWLKRQTIIRTGKFVYRRDGKATLTFIIDGGKLRFEYVGEQTTDGATIDQNYAAAFDGNLNRSLFLPAEKSLQPYPNGFIGGRSTSAALLDTLPLRWLFALSQPVMAEVDVEALTVGDTEGFVDGTRCVVAHTTANPALPAKPGMSAPPGAGYSYWLDPSAGYSIRRYAWDYGGKTSVQIDAEYTLDKSGVWIPQTWTSWRFDSMGQPTETARLKMTDYQINPKLTGKDFSIEFPPGTIVSDSSAGKTLNYLLKKNGEKRIITAAEAQVPYERILVTESGHGHLQAKPYLTFRLLIGGVALAILIASVGYWRFRLST
jgi:hypothetical protein